ncbi:uncharacterized protein [Taeniopygia guttata]|uniref:uncharacterized protein n=1 Tax=Taeniopygia guttata TaxID=59729 RepID=UPI003BB99082
MRTAWGGRTLPSVFWGFGIFGNLVFWEFGGFWGFGNLGFGILGIWGFGVRVPGIPALLSLSRIRSSSGTASKRSRDPPGSRWEFRTPPPKRLRAAPENTQKNSQNSQEIVEKAAPARRLQIPAGNPGIPTGNSGILAENSGIPERNSGIPVGNSGIPTGNSGLLAGNAGMASGNPGILSGNPGIPGIPVRSQLSVAQFYGSRNYRDPPERKRLRELLGHGEIPEKTRNSGNSDRKFRNPGGKSGDSARKPGIPPGNLGILPGRAAPKAKGAAGIPGIPGWGIPGLRIPRFPMLRTPGIPGWGIPGFPGLGIPAEFQDEEFPHLL